MWQLLLLLARAITKMLFCCCFFFCFRSTIVNIRIMFFLLLIGIFCGVLIIHSCTRRARTLCNCEFYMTETNKKTHHVVS